MIDELQLSEAHAEAIIEKAIEFQVYTDDMPQNKKDKLEAAHEVVAFAIDSWVDDEVRPDSDDEDVAAAGQQILEIFELAGVEVDDDGDITYGDPPALDEEGGDNGGDDDEGAFDIDDIIEGYEELTPATRLKKIKALELDPEDEDDFNTLVAIKEWEEEQEKPSSRVLDYLAEFIEDDGEGGGDDDEEGGEPEAEGGDDESEEPWEGYEDAKVADIKEVLNDDERTVEELEYVLGYEEGREKPRAQIVKLCKQRIEELSDNGGDDPEPEPEEKPKRRGRKSAKSNDPDESGEVDEAVARDDEKEERKAAKNGRTLTLTREQIVAALAEGEIEIVLTTLG